MFTIAFGVVGLGVGTLTWLGLRDAPTRFDPNAWGPQSIAGYLLAEGPDATCGRCHVNGGPGSPVRDTRISRDDDWLLFHMADPVAIAPGARPAEPAFEPVLDDDQARAVLAYLRRLRAGGVLPHIEPASAGPLQTWARAASPATPSTATAGRPARN